MTQPQELSISPLTLPADEIARFIAGVYDSYDHGTSLIPRWNGAFLKHVVLAHPAATAEHALAAHVGDRLVGVILAQPQEVWVGNSLHRVAHSSWLAVTNEGARHFAALHLINAQRERLAAHGTEALFGVAYRSGKGVGLDFWEGLARAFPTEVVPGPELTFWARVLDGRSLAGAVSNPLLRAGATAALLRPVLRPAADPQIRAFAGGDLEACRRIMAASTSQMRICPSLWDLTPTAAPDEGPQTLVMEGSGGIVAFSSFHILPMEDAGPLRVAIIELINVAHGSSGLSRLLTQVLWQAKSAGACLALIPRKPHLSASMMVLAGFVPYQAGFKYMYMPLASSIAQQMPASFDLLVR